MHKATTPTFPPPLSASLFSPTSPRSRPPTRDGSAALDPAHLHPYLPPVPAAAQGRTSRKSSGSGAASTRRRGSSSGIVVTDAAVPPALPDYALPVAARVQRRRDAGDGAGRSPVDGGFANMLSRSLTATAAAPGPPPTPVTANGPSASIWQPSEASVMHQHVTELASKRISTLDYLRKAHEGRVYWFNTYLFDKPDLARMPCFDPRKLARKATNHLLLGLSVPTINDLYSSTALEFLRSLNSLLSEFDSFQQLHGDSSSATLTRARLPNMFRRPGGKSRRSASAADLAAADDSQQSLSVAGGGSAASASSASSAAAAAAAASANGSTPSVMSFAAAESDLLPGEEYTYLLTPSLPFEPDFFETFATLCDVLIDCYSRFLTLVPTPRECSAPVGELFTKADSKLRKIIVQGVVKEFEEHSRSHVKTEVASIGKVVLGGLM